jgi:hypothetical protein
MNTKKPDDVTRLFAALAILLPGDRIHDTAPVSRQTQSSLDKVEAIDKAQAKRIRKQRKVAALLKKTTNTREI